MATTTPPAVTPLPPSLMCSVTEAARLMGVSRTTAYDMVNRGDFPKGITVRTVGQRILINRAQLEAWCAGEDGAS